MASWFSFILDIFTHFWINPKDPLPNIPSLPGITLYDSPSKTNLIIWPPTQLIQNLCEFWLYPVDLHSSIKFWVFGSNLIIFRLEVWSNLGRASCAYAGTSAGAAAGAAGAAAGAAGAAAAAASTSVSGGGVAGASFFNIIGNGHDNWLIFLSLLAAK